jgi:hypothetical protein
MSPEFSPFNGSLKPPRITVRGVVLRLALCWALYTLSIGPMYWTWFGAAYVNGSYWVHAFYSPLRYACEYVPYYGDLVEGYIWWWNFPAPEVILDPNQQLVAG